MAALNKKTASITPVHLQATPMKHSANGNLQYIKTNKTSLIEIATATLYGKDTFYNSSDELFTRLKSNLEKLVLDNELDFIANVALYARTQMDLRTYPIVLVVELAAALARSKKHYLNMRQLVRDVITRCDELTELYSYALKVFGSKKSIPLAIKKGVADAFNKFDEYQFSKYNGGNKSLTFKDLLRIVHPKPANEEKSKIFAGIMNDSLAIAYTWETQLSANGQKHELEQKPKATIWKELISSNKLGYMALLKNLRNIEETKDATLIQMAATNISNESLVLRSKQLPMSFLQAYENVTSTVLKNAIANAIKISSQNIPNMGNEILVVVDNSGSMSGNPIKLASLFASMIVGGHKDSKVTGVVFGNAAGYVNFSDDFNQTSTIIARSGFGGGTNFDSVIKLIGNNKYDAVFILSDGDVNRTSLSRCAKLGVNKDSVQVIFNFNASETTPFKENSAFFITGLSHKVFNYLKYSNESNGIADLLSVPYKAFPVVYKK